MTRWSKQVDARGRVFYVDHNKRSTTWTRPRYSLASASLLQPDGAAEAGLDQQRRIFDQRAEASPAQTDLPSGWERRLAPNGQYYYIDHNTQRTTWTHPNEIQRYQ